MGKCLETCVREKASNTSNRFCLLKDPETLILTPCAMTILELQQPPEEGFCGDDCVCR